MINPVVYNNNPSIYRNYSIYSPRSTTEAVSRISPVTPVNEKANLSVYKTEPSECNSCKSRKYVDQSKEGNVSFKTPTHISPSASYGKVVAHESEHVANAKSKTNQPGANLISASVSLKMDICPECGTSYVAGGETRTQIKYDVENPYEKNRMAVEGSLLKGMNVDYVA